MSGYGTRVVALVAFVCSAAAAQAGTVRGRVELIERGGRKAVDLSDVVVWVEGAKSPPQPTRATIRMKGKVFIPRVLVVPVGATVEFPNDDPILHNVFSVSGENRFDLDLYKRPKTGSWTFRHPGIARVYCNIHPQMSAIVVVRDNPYFAKAGREGAFALPDVPPGRYTIRAWHERGGESVEEVTVPADGAVEVQLTLDASRFRRVQHKNKFGKDYGAEKY